MASSDGIRCELNEKGNSKFKKECVVCKEPAQGFNFGALVCLPCKSFYIRCSKEDVIYSKCNGNCDIFGENRIRCQYCRYQQCLKVGMKPREKPERYLFAFDESLCMVCGDLSNGIHFGVSTCEGCKKFFRRCLLESSKLICVNERRCRINPKTRNRCRLCRYLKCLQVGMSKSAVKIGRPRNSRKLPKLKQKANSSNAAYDDWVQTLLSDVKRHSPDPLERNQWLSTIQSCGFTSDEAFCQSVSASMENTQSSQVKLTRITKPTTQLFNCISYDDHSPSKLNGTINELQEQTLQTPSIEMIKNHDYDSWTRPRADYNQQQQMITTYQTNNGNTSKLHYGSLHMSQQLCPRTSSNDFALLKHANTTSLVTQEHHDPGQLYTDLKPKFCNDLNEVKHNLNPNQYLYGFQYTQTGDDDLLNLLENCQQLNCESLVKSKSTSNIVSEAHNAAQDEINERSFWNYPEENLTQLYKSAEFLSLPNLTQLRTSINKQSDVQVAYLSVPELDSSDFIYD